MLLLQGMGAFLDVKWEFPKFLGYLRVPLKGSFKGSYKGSIGFQGLGSFRKLGVPYFGVLIIRILLSYYLGYYIRGPFFWKLPNISMTSPLRLGLGLRGSIHLSNKRVSHQTGFAVATVSCWGAGFLIFGGRH